MEIHSHYDYPPHSEQAYPNQVAFLTTVHYVTTGAFCSKISHHLVTTTGLTCSFASVECDCHYCSWFEKFFDTTLRNISSRKFGVFVSQVNKLLRIFVLQSKKIDYLLGCYHKHTTCTCTVEATYEGRLYKGQLLIKDSLKSMDFFLPLVYKFLPFIRNTSNAESKWIIQYVWKCLNN